MIFWVEDMSEQNITKEINKDGEMQNAAKPFLSFSWSASIVEEGTISIAYSLTSFW